MIAMIPWYWVVSAISVVLSLLVVYVIAAWRYRWMADESRLGEHDGWPCEPTK